MENSINIAPSNIVELTTSNLPPLYSRGEEKRALGIEATKVHCIFSPSWYIVFGEKPVLTTPFPDFFIFRSCPSDIVKSDCAPKAIYHWVEICNIP